MTRRPKALLFDLDGTISDRDGSFRELLHAQYGKFQAELKQIPRERFVERVIALDEHGYVDRASVYSRLSIELQLPETVATCLTAHFHGSYSSFAMFFPEVPATLNHLRAQGLKLGIVTNGSTAMQRSKVDALQLSALVDCILVSEQEGVRKPDKEIFERALRRLGVSADEAWYVGDHPIVDIRGAFDAGLTPVWRKTSHWPDPDVPCHTIHTLDELIRLLG